MHETSTVWNELARRILTVQQIRDVDRVAIEQYGMSSLVLMENAAQGCVHWLRGKFPTPSSAVVLCGRGNNGGDGLAIARHLRVHVGSVASQCSGQSNACRTMRKPTSASFGLVAIAN